MKKIAIVTQNILILGGIEKVVDNLIKGFLSEDCKVDILYIRKGNLSQSLIHDKNLRYIQLHSDKRYRAINQIREYIKKENPDAIIGAGRYHSMLASLAKIGIKNKTKLIVTQHSNHKFGTEEVESILLKLKIYTSNKLCNILFNKADNVIAVSKSLQSILSKDIKNKKLKTIYNPVLDEEFYKKANEDIDMELYRQKDKKIIVHIGRIAEEKNQTLLIDAFYSIKDKVNANLIIVGKGPLEDDIVKKVESMKLKDRVFIIGYKSNPYPYLKNADLFVLSSKTEAAPLVICEALALYKNIVSTDCEVGPRELLKDGKYGILCKQNIEDLSNSILLGLENNIEENKNKDIDEYLNQFTIEYATKRYLELI